MAEHLRIETPRGAVFNTTTRSGKVTAKLEWNDGFGPERTKIFTDAQKFVDSEVLRYCAPLVPFKTGMLQKSGTLGTVIGSGEVCWVAPYAAAQYYRVAGTHGGRGPYWFERMKIDHGAAILRGAAAIAGGKTK